MQRQQTAALGELIADDVDWSIFGPTDMFPFLGSYRGRDAALKICCDIAAQVQFDNVSSESTILNEDSAATMARVKLTLRATNRPVSIRLAKFIRFEDDRLISMRAVMDTFDLVEQALGQEIHLPKIA